MVCITLREKASYYFLKTTKRKLENRMTIFYWIPLLGSKKKLWTESLALTSFSRWPIGLFIMLEICILFCWLNGDRTHSLPPFGGISSTWMANSSFAECVSSASLPSSSPHSFLFPWLAPFELLREIFLRPKIKASVIDTVIAPYIGKGAEYSLTLYRS